MEAASFAAPVRDRDWRVWFGELRENNAAIQAQYEQMRRTAENAAIQARAIRANALHQQQETTLLVADRVHKQLGGVGACSGCRASSSPTARP